jgi:hypothetical protein
MSEEVKRYKFLLTRGFEPDGRMYDVSAPNGDVHAHGKEYVLASAHDRVVAALLAELAPHLARDQRMSAAEAQRDLLLRENEELTKRLTESEHIAAGIEADRNVTIGELGQKNAALLARCEKAERDAARYRWFRSRWEGPVRLQTTTVEGPDADDLEWGDERIGAAMDAAIDAARGSEGAKNE